MNAEGVTKDDVKLPDDDIGRQIQTDFDEGKELLVTIVAAMGEEQVSRRSPVLPITFSHGFSSLRRSPTRKPLRVLGTSFKLYMF
jgi:hypothetical protein